MSSRASRPRPGRRGVPAVGRLIHGKHVAPRRGSGSHTLRDYPRHHNIYLRIVAHAPGGPGSTLHGITGIHLAGNRRIVTCVNNRNRGLRRRSVILIHNNHIGSLPNIHCRVIHNTLSYLNISGHHRNHSGCNTGHPGTTTGWAGRLACCVL